MASIYKITNSINEKFYIGSAVYPSRRISVHICLFKKGTHSNPIMQNHVNKYGIGSLNFEEIEDCERGIMIKREQHYIDTLNPEWNINRIAQSPKGLKRTKQQIENMIAGRMAKSGYPKGRVVSKETRRKIGKAHKGKTIPQWHRDAIGTKNTGRIVNSEVRKKISDKAKGREFSDEHKRNLSISAKGNQNGRKK